MEDNSSSESEFHITPEALKALEDERLAFGETEPEMAQRLFKQELVSSAYSITHMAKYAVNERLRYEAAKYVVERNLGRIQDTNPTEATDPFDALLANCVVSLDEDAALQFASKVLNNVMNEPAPSPFDSTDGVDEN